MKKFKLVYWSDCRGVEINGESVGEFENGREVLEYLIEDKIDEEGWCDYVSDMINDRKGMWLSDKKKWDMFVIGDLDKEVFNFWLVLKNNLEDFEKKFARLMKVKYAIGVNSGTDAIKLSLKVLGVKSGDEVITAANTFVATVGAITELGAIPVFVDCD
jgi:hypothetical protein